MRARVITTIIMLLMTMAGMAQKPFELPLYEGEAPYENGDTARLYVYPAPEKTATGRAVVICPGGAYAHLAMDHEGKDWAPFFNNLGITAVVLKYRMPKGDSRVPLADAEQAMKLVRANADKWNINRGDLGIMGSSAGGHLASTLAVHGCNEALPNFQILFYPVITMDPAFTHMGSHDNLLGKDAKKKQEQHFSTDAHVTRKTAPAWIALSDDDHAVLPANGFNYYFECYRHDVPASLHIYPSGGHGWGIRESFPYHTEMTLELKAWLRSF